MKRIIEKSRAYSQGICTCARDHIHIPIHFIQEFSRSFFQGNAKPTKLLNLNSQKLQKKALRTINRCPCARWKQFLLSIQNSFVSPSPQILIFIFKLFFFPSNHPLYHVTRHRVNRISRHFSLGRLWYFLFWFSILSYFDTRVKPWRQILVSLPAPSDSLAQTYLLSPSPRHHSVFSLSLFFRFLTSRNKFSGYFSRFI